MHQQQQQQPQSQKGVNWNRLWQMHMTTMTPQQHAALQQSLSSHPTAIPNSSESQAPWPQRDNTQEAPVGMTAQMWEADTHSLSRCGRDQHQEQQLLMEQQQFHAMGCFQDPAPLTNTGVTGYSAYAAQSVHEGLHGSHHTSLHHGHDDALHGRNVRPGHLTVEQPLPLASTGPSSQQHPVGTAATGSGPLLPVLQGHPVGSAAAAAALPTDGPTLAEQFPVADPVAFAQQQTQLYYAMVCEEAGNVRHDIHELVTMSGLHGSAAEAAVELGMRRTAACSAAAAAAMLADLNEEATDQILSTILSDPVELDWQQLLLDDVQANCKRCCDY